MGGQQKIFPGYAADEVIAVVPMEARHRGYVVWSRIRSCVRSFDDKHNSFEARMRVEPIFDEYFAQMQVKGVKRAVACASAPEFKQGGE